MIALPEPRVTPHGKVRAAPFGGDEALPAETEVVVIGGGINGTVVAWNLARRGVPVLLCEKGEIGAEASSRAFGWVSELLLDPAKMTLSRLSKEGWAELQREAGEMGFRTEGLCYLAASDQEMDFYSGWLASVAGQGAADNHLIDSDGAAARFPGASRRWRGGIVAPSDGCAEPQLAATAVAHAARRAGAKIVTGCAVRGLELETGRIAGVVTESGRVRARAVVFCGNAWSRLFMGRHGVDVPQLYVIMSMGRTGPVPDGPVGFGGRNEWAWRRQVDGGYALGGLGDQRFPLTRDSIQLFSRFLPLLRVEKPFLRPSFDADMRRDWSWPRRWRLDEVSPFERHRVLDPIARRARPDTSLADLKREFPAFGPAQVTEAWAGAITVTPDNQPIASAVDAIPGLYLITGCSYGLTWAPALGRMIADQITGSTPALDPTPYRLSRFFDGRPLKLTH